MKRSLKLLGWALTLTLFYHILVFLFGFEATVITLLACAAAERIDS